MVAAVVVDEDIDVEYVGDPDPLDDVTKLRIVMGEIPTSAANVLRSAAIQRFNAIKGVSIRKVDPEFFGVSKPYVFGPHSFFEKVTRKDYEIIKASASGHQFRRAGDPARLVLPRDGEEGLVLVKTTEYNQQESVMLLEQSLQRRR